MKYVFMLKIHHITYPSETVDNGCSIHFSIPLLLTRACILYLSRSRVPHYSQYYCRVHTFVVGGCSLKSICVPYMEVGIS